MFFCLQQNKWFKAALRVESFSTDLKLQIDLVKTKRARLFENILLIFINISLSWLEKTPEEMLQ